MRAERGKRDNSGMGWVGCWNALAALLARPDWARDLTASELRRHGSGQDRRGGLGSDREGERSTEGGPEGVECACGVVAGKRACASFPPTPTSHPRASAELPPLPIHPPARASAHATHGALFLDPTPSPAALASKQAHVRLAPPPNSPLTRASTPPRQTSHAPRMQACTTHGALMTDPPPSPAAPAIK